MINRDPITLEMAIAKYGPGILDHLKLVKPLVLGSGIQIIPPSVPDGVYSISPNEPISTIPVCVWTPPAAFVLATDQVIATLTPAAGKVIYISAISMTSNKPATAQWTLVIKGQTMFTTQKIQTVLNLDWPGENNGRGIKLNAGESAIIYCRSDGATSVLADGLIVGVQEG
jgi:hypothetical protein